MYSNKVTPTTEVRPFTSVPQKPEVFDELFDEYPPVRVRLTDYVVSFNTDNVATVVIPIKYGKLLHPTRTMVQVEYCSLDDSQKPFLDQDPINFQIQLPEITSAYDFEGPAEGPFDYSKVVWQGISTKTTTTYYNFPPYSHPINTNEVGFPIRDPYFLNNKNLTINFFALFAGEVTYPVEYMANLSLVFYTYTGGK